MVWPDTTHQLVPGLKTERAIQPKAAAPSLVRCEASRPALKRRLVPPSSFRVVGLGCTGAARGALRHVAQFLLQRTHLPAQCGNGRAVLHGCLLEGFDFRAHFLAGNARNFRFKDGRNVWHGGIVPFKCKFEPTLKRLLSNRQI
jgi:hypothetical protein